MRALRTPCIGSADRKKDDRYDFAGGAAAVEAVVSFCNSDAWFCGGTSPVFDEIPDAI